MPKIRELLIAGIAAMTLAGLGTRAAEADPARHEMSVPLPGGGIEHIEYYGSQAPKVVFEPVIADFESIWPSSFAMVADPNFAQFDRIAAQMDRQMDALFSQMPAVGSGPWAGTAPVSAASLQNMPRGMSSYSMISTASGDDVCTQTLQITAPGNGSKPQVIRHSFGHCAPPASVGAKPAAPHSGQGV